MDLMQSIESHSLVRAELGAAAILYCIVHIPLGPENRQDSNRAELYTLISRCYDSVERRVTLHSKLLSRVGPLKQQHPASHSPRHYRENQDAGPNSYQSALRRSSQLVNCSCQ